MSLPGGLAIGGVVADRPTQPDTVPSSPADADADEDTVTAPMQGTVTKVAVEDGQEVTQGDLIVVLEAMKMENPITAHKAGIITGLAVQPGAAVTQGTPIAQLK